MPDFKLTPYIPPTVPKPKTRRSRAKSDKIKKTVKAADSIADAFGFAKPSQAAARAKEIAKAQELEPATAFRFNTGVEKAALGPKRKTSTPKSIEEAMAKYDLEKYGRRTYGATDDPERKKYLDSLRKSEQDRQKVAPFLDPDAKYQNPKEQFNRPLVRPDEVEAGIRKIGNEEQDKRTHTQSALIPVQPREKTISSELSDQVGGIRPNSGPGSPKSATQYLAQNRGNLEGVMAEFDIKHYGRPTYGENESPERRRFRLEYERMAKFDRSPYSAIDLAIASRGNTDSEKLVWDREGTKQVPFAQAVKESEKAMGLAPGSLNIERLRNSDAFVWQLQREGTNAGGQLKSERGIAEASGVKYKPERANEGDLNAASFMSGGLTDIFEATRRIVAGESWESVMDTRSGRMASLVGDRLGFGSGETTRRAGFAKSQDNPGIGDASNFDLGLMAVSDAIGGVNATLTQAGTGRSSRNLSGKTRAINAGIDFAQEMVLSLVGGGAIAGTGKTLLGTLGRGFVAENIFDAPDYIQMVKASGFVEGTKEFTLALMNQFNPAVLFDPNREVEEKVITGMSLALLGLGKGADIAITKANSQVIDKAWGQADLGEVRKHLESAALAMLRKTNVTSILPGDIRKQAKYVAFQYLQLGSEIYGDKVQVQGFVEAATEAMKNGSLESVVTQAMQDAQAKATEVEAQQQAQEAQQVQEVDEGVGADDVIADLEQGKDVTLTAGQWQGLSGELAESMIQLGAVADEDAAGNVVIRAAEDEFTKPKFWDEDSRAEEWSPQAEAEAYKPNRGRNRNVDKIPPALRAGKPFRGGTIEHVLQDDDGSWMVKVRMPDGSTSVSAEPKTETKPEIERPKVEDADVAYSQGQDPAAWWKSITHNGREHVARKAGIKDAVAVSKTDWRHLKDDLRKQVLEAAKPLASQPQQADPDVPIGKNSEGFDVYENADGVRSVSRNGVRVTEPVAISPSRGGMRASLAGPRQEQFKTTDEIGEGDAVKTSLAEGDRVTQTKDGYEVGRDDTAPIRKKGNRYEASAMATGVRSTKGVAFRPKNQTEWRALNALVEDGIVRKFDRDRDGDYDYAHGISTSFVLTDVGEKWAQSVGYDFRTDHRHMKDYADRLRRKANDAMESGAPGANELDHKAGEAEIAYADAIWETGERLNAGENLPDDAKITNRIDPDAKPSEKLAQLAKLSDENETIIRGILDKMAQGGVKGGLSRKMPHRILQKSMRPSILAAKPWHRMEHIRDSLRFKIISLSFEDIVTFAELLPPGAEVIKVDFQKMFNPGVWGWRFWGVDLRMPNGQIVEMYMPLQEVEVAKKEGHKIFEKWRNATDEELSGNSEYRADVRKSRDLYESAFHAALTRMGYRDGASLNIDEALKDFTMASERASAVISSKLSESSELTPRSSQSSDPANRKPIASRSRENTSTRPSGDSNTRNSGLNNIEDTTHIIDVSESRRVQSHRLPPSGSKMNLGSKFTGGTPEENEVEAKLRRIVKSLDADSIYDQIPSTHGGKIIGTDNAREMSPEYAEGKEGAARFTRATAKLASAYAKDRIVRELENRGERRSIMFTIGGVAAGKTTAIGPEALAEVDLVYDGLMRNPDDAIALIQLAVDNGWRVEAINVHRPIANVIKSAVLRAYEIGRWGPVAELPLTHIQSQRSFAKIVERFRHNDSVKLKAVLNAWVDGSQHQESSGAVGLDRVLEGGDLWHNESEAVHETERAWQEIVESGRFPREFLSRLAQPIAGGPVLSGGVERPSDGSGNQFSERRGEAQEEPEPPLTIPDNQQEASAEQAGASSYSEGDQVRQRLNGETRTGVVTGVAGNTITVRWSGQGSGAEYTNPAGDRIMVTKKADPAPGKDQPKRIVSDDAMAQALKDLMDDGPPAAAGAGLGALASFSPKKVKALVILAVGYIERGVSSVVELLAKFAEQGVTLTEAQALEAYDIAADVVDGVTTLEEVERNLAGEPSVTKDQVPQNGNSQSSSIENDGEGVPIGVADGVRGDDAVAGSSQRPPNADGGDVRGDDIRVPGRGDGGGRSGAGGAESGADGERSGREGDGDRGTASAKVGRGRDYRLDGSTKPGHRREQLAPPSGVAAKTDRLIAALRALASANKRGHATPDEQSKLALFPGWGFNKQILNPGKAEGQTARALELNKLITRSQRADALRAGLNSHFTDPAVVGTMWDAVAKLGAEKGLSILEPASGSGLFPMLMPENMWDGSKWTMVELDQTTADVARFLFPEQTVINSGFERANVQKDAVDLTITNVPFAGGEINVIDPNFADQVGDHQTAAMLSTRLHNYFITKSVLATRPGGIVAVITSKGTMDAADTAGVTVRRWLADNTDLVAAVRLPSTAFQDQANTEVVTDVLILRRRDNNSPVARAWTDLRGVKLDLAANEDGEIVQEDYHLNEYFKANSRYILGTQALSGSMYRGNSYNVVGSGDPVAKSLAKALGKQIDQYRADFESANPGVPVFTAMGPAGPVAIPPKSDQGYVIGEVYRDGKEFRQMGAYGHSALLDLGKDTKLWGDYVTLKEALAEVYSNQAAADSKLEASQKKLKSAYDRFVKAHGPLHKARVIERAAKDPDTGLPVLDEEGNPVMDRTLSYTTRRILEKDSAWARIFSLELWDPESLTVKSLADVFSKRVVNYDQDITTLESAHDALYASMNIRGKVDMDWITAVLGKSEDDVVKELGSELFRHVDGTYFSRADYMSGPTGIRMREVQAAIDQGLTEFQANADALKGALPPRETYENIFVTPRQHWIPENVLQAFAVEVFGAPRHDVGKYVRKIKNAASYELSKWHAPSSVTSTWTHETKTPYDILRAYLHMSDGTIRVKDSEGKSFVDKESTDAFLALINRVEPAFREWADSRFPVQEAITEAFNTVVNVNTVRRFDGSRLTFPGLNTHEVELRTHRVNAIARAMSEPFTLWWHGVGSGKTYTAAMLAMKLKQTGLRNKVMVLAYKPTLEQVVGEMSRAYPTAKILAAGEDSLSPRHRGEFMGRIATGDWDIVVVTQEQFASIPISIEAVAAQYDQLIDRAMQEFDFPDMEAVLRAKGKFAAPDTRQAARTIADLASQRDKMIDKLNQSTASMTFESLGVDQLIVDEAHMFKGLPVTTRHSGLVSQGTSIRATMLEAKLAYIRKQGGGATYMTGTALVNSGGEVHNWLRLSNPVYLEELGILKFDNFINQFAKTEQLAEVTYKGTIEVKTRIRGWNSTQQLAAVFSRFADVVRTEDVPEITLPTLEDQHGNPTNTPISIAVPATAAQREAIKDIYSQLVKLKDRYTDPIERAAARFRLMDEARKASQDLRMISPDMPGEEAGLKVLAMASEVSRIYHDTEADRAAQVVFIDMGVPGGSIPFNVFEEFRRVAIAQGVKPDDIAMITAKTKIADRLRIAQGIRSGRYRILIGSRPKLGVGMNIQARLKAAHHLMLGWNPALLEQGNGRIVRFGNRYKQVQIYYYVTQGTGDQVQASRTIIKQGVFVNFMKALTGVLQGRADVPDINEDEGALALGELAAVASNDPRLTKLVELGQALTKALRASEYMGRSIAIAKAELQAKSDAEPHLERQIGSLRADIDAATELGLGVKHDELLNVRASEEAKYQLSRHNKDAMTEKDRRPETDKGAVDLWIESGAYQYRPVADIITGDDKVAASVTVLGGTLFFHKPTDRYNHGLEINPGPSFRSHYSVMRNPIGHIMKEVSRLESQLSSIRSDMGALRKSAERTNTESEKVEQLRAEMLALEFETGVTSAQIESGGIDLNQYRPSQSIEFPTISFTTEAHGDEDVRVTGINSAGSLSGFLGSTPHYWKAEGPSGASLGFAEVWQKVQEAMPGITPPPYLSRSSEMDSKEAQLIANYRALQDALGELSPPPSVGTSPKRKGKRQPADDQLNLRSRPQLNHPDRRSTPTADEAIAIAPVTGVRPKRKDQIILDLNKALGSRKAVSGTSGRATVGNYLPRSRSRWVRGTTDLVTTAHEIMHEVDDRYGLFAEWKDAAPTDLPSFFEELRQPAFQGTVEEGMSPWHVRAEQLAEWGRSLIINPEETRRITPEFSKFWDETVPEKTRDAITAFSDDLRAFAGASGREAIIASMDAALDGETGKGFASWWNRRLDEYEQFRRETTGEDAEGNFRVSLQDRIRVKLTDDMAPAASAFREVFRRRGLAKDRSVNPDLPSGLDDKQNPMIWMRRLPYLDQVMSGFIDHGFEDINGRPITGSVAEMFAELDNTSPDAFARDFEDMSALLMAERQIELGERIARRSEAEIAERAENLTDRYESRLDSYANRLNRQLSAWLDGSLTQLAIGTNKAIKESVRDGMSKDERVKAERRILDKAAKDEKALRDKAQKAYDRGMKDYAKKAKAKLDFAIETVSNRIKDQRDRETQGQFALGADGLRVAMDDARATIGELSANVERFDRLKEAVRRYREFGDWTLQTLVDHGLLSEADRQGIRDANQYWFSAQRIMDGDVVPFIRSAAGLSGAKPTVKKKGTSGRITSNVIDNLLEQMYQTLQEATRNSVLRTWTDLMAPTRGMYGPNDPDFADLATQLPEGADPTPTTITFFRDGVKEFWDVTDPVLYETLARIGKGADDAETRFALNALAFPTTLLRNSITWTPAFAIRNLGRDTETRMITSPYRNTGASFAPRMPDADLQRAFDTHAIGAGRGTHLNDADNFAKVRRNAILEILAENGSVWQKARHYVTAGPRAYMRMLEAGEKKNRAEVFRAALDYAKTELGRDYESARLYAAHESRSVMTDFRRSGQWSKKLNRFIPFFNASIQGQSASWTRIAQNPAKSMTRLMVWSAAMIALERAWAAMMGDEEDREQRDPMQRDLFFKFKVGDDLYVSVPKPHDLGLVTSAIDRTIDWYGGDDHAFEGAIGRAFNVMSPAGLDDMLGPARVVAEIGWNRNFFTDKAIVSPYEEHLAQDLRKGGAYASPIGRRFAMHLGGDPRQWDHFIRGQFGNVGRGAIDISRASAGERAPGTLVSLTGIASNAPMYGARDVQWVLKTAKANGIGKTHLDELQDKYFEATDATVRDKLAGEIVKYAKALRVKMEAAMAGKSGEKRAEALREVVSAAKKDQKGAGTFSAPKFALPKFKINSP